MYILKKTGDFYMKRILLLFTILLVSVLTTACINNLAIQELNNKAVAYMDKGDTETAICRLKSSLDLDDEIFQTHYNLAVAYNTIGKYKESLEESKKVLELKPDFLDAIYTLAVAKEALAYELIDDKTILGADKPELSMDEIAEFNNAAQGAIDAYNEYLVKKVDAKETDEVNAKIAELNQKIKELTQIYDTKSMETQNLINKEIKKSNVSSKEEIITE